MTKKSVFVKTITCLFTATIVAGALTYSSERFEPKKLDLSAFQNAAANITHLRKEAEIKPNELVSDVTGDIVKVIEKEVRGKIRHTRYSLKATLAKRIDWEKEVIAKNWNDIRPEFAAADHKLSEVKLKTITTNDAVLEFGINNSELIKQYGFEVDSLNFETFSDIEMASYEVQPAPEMKIDEVKTVQAATETETKAQEVEAVSDELVMFDYSEKEAKEVPEVKKMFDAPISSSVKEAIEREVQGSNIARVQLNTQKRQAPKPEITADQATLEKAMEDEDNLVFDYSHQNQAALIKKEESAFTAESADTTTQAEFTIKASEVNVNTQKTRQTFGFEFVPDYDRAERTDDQASGEIKLGYSLAGDVSTQTGVVQSHGLIPTRVELNLLNKGINVPLLNEEGIQKFLEKKEMDIVGNLLMVAVDESIMDIEIDSEYQQKLFLNKNLKLSDSKEKASYVIFLGVKSGNILMRYLLSNKESAQKIVYVGEGEMYFEDPDFVNTQRELYTFTTRSLLGRKVKELNINAEDISLYGSKTQAKKKALNAYEIKIPDMVENSRKYLEFKHLGSSLFVGTKSAKEIEIPGRDFIGRVLEANQLNDLGERCMVQVNLTKDLRDLKVNGKNKSGEMFVETSFLDTDGNFSRDNSELSEKVFVTGDQEGVFNIRLDYTDGSTDFLKTFCSEGSYLIEQL